MPVFLLKKYCTEFRYVKNGGDLMRRNNFLGKIVFVIVLIVSVIIAVLGTPLVIKVAPIDLSNYTQPVFFALFIVLGAVLELIAAKIIGGRR